MTPASPYRTGREIARGGMGAVLDARDQKLGRSVAMKVMLRRNASEEEQQRFLQEARVLGQLAHPNIVPVHDVGMNEQGRLFYTMKLVVGVTLHDVIGKLKAGDKDTLAKYPLNALLTAFQKVCDAVAFAHSRGIIHRDLKPQNIMVGEFGEVLVMDWGLAKILPGSPAAAEAARTGPLRIQAGTSAPQSAPPSGSTTGLRSSVGIDPTEAATLPLVPKPTDDATLVYAPAPAPSGPSGIASEAATSGSSYATLEGAVMGTPHYMPPEQADGRVAELDERSDVYSLGGVLHALLTLRPPVEGKDTSEVLNKVLHGDITAPALATRGNKLPHLPNGLVPHALSVVCMKALQVARRDRYQTVTEFEQDIAAYQGGFATSAEDANPLARFRLFILRHKVLSAVTSLTVLLTIFFVGTLIKSEELAKAHAERADQSAKHAMGESQKAKAEAEKAIAMAQFLSGLFDDADPVARHGRAMGASPRRGPSVTARDMLDRGAATLRTSLKDDPAIRAVLLDKVGNVYISMGLYSQAAPLVDEALELRTKLFGPDHVETAASLHTKGLLDGYQGQYESGLKRMNAALDIYRKGHAQGHPLVSDVALDLAVLEVANNNLTKASQLLLTALEIRRRAFGENSREALAPLMFLAVFENSSGRRNPERIMEVAKVWDGAGRTEEFGAFVNLGLNAVVTAQLDPAKAADLFQEAERRGTALLGSNHLYLNIVRNEHAAFLSKTGQLPEAREKYQAVISSVQSALGTNCVFLIAPLEGLARLEYGARNYAVLAGIYRQLISLMDAQAQRESAQVESRKYNRHLGRWIDALNSLKRHGEAEQEIRRILLSIRDGGIYSELKPAAFVDRLGVAVLGQAGINLAPADLAADNSSGQQALSAAKLCAKAAAALAKRTPNPTEADRLVIGLLMDQAVMILKNALARGAPKPPDLRTDPDWSVLRLHKDFAPLVEPGK